MGLIDLQTNLKGLGFGDDRYKRGDSNEPYIQTQIPATNDPLQTGFSLSGAGLETLGIAAASAGAGAAIGAIGGSILGATGAGALIGTAVGLGIGIAGAAGVNSGNSSFKVPNAGTGGPDFLLRGGTLLPNRIANDVERISKLIVDTKSAKGILFVTKQNLLSRLAVKTEGTQGSLLNDGVYLPTSTLASVAGVAFGGYYNKQGTNPFAGTGEAYVPNRYYDSIKEQLGDNEYSLNRLYNLYDVKILQSNLSSFPLNITPKQKQLGISELPTNILSYRGGPGAPLGIGNTNIKFADQRTGINNPAFAKALKNNNFRNYSDYQSGVKYSPNGAQSKELETLSKDVTVIGSHYLARNFHIKRPYLQTGSFTERKTNIGGLSQQNYYTKGNDIGDRPSDLIDFYFTIINNVTPNNNYYLYFPAYINSFNDSYGAEWSSDRFLGRGENFYTYNGFNRDISLDFDIYVSNGRDISNYMYYLNLLSSCLTPNYSNNGFMRGTINKLTIGRYLEDVPGIITSLKYDIPLDSPWDVVNPIVGGDEQPVQLPMYIKVSLSYKPIHKFTPSTGNSPFISPSLTTRDIGSYSLPLEENQVGQSLFPPNKPSTNTPSELDNKIQQSPFFTDGEKYKILNSGNDEKEKQLIYDLRTGVSLQEPLGEDIITNLP